MKHVPMNHINSFAPVSKLTQTFCHQNLGPSFLSLVACAKGQNPSFFFPLCPWTLSIPSNSKSSLHSHPVQSQPASSVSDMYHPTPTLLLTFFPPCPQIDLAFYLNLSILSYFLPHIHTINKTCLDFCFVLSVT